MKQIAHVSFDTHSSQVVGWDSIWAIIEGEDKGAAEKEEERLLKEKLQHGVDNFVNKQRSSGAIDTKDPKNPLVDNPGPRPTDEKVDDKPQEQHTEKPVEVPVNSYFDGNLEQFRDFVVDSVDSHNFVL